jgi:hypothetical protein
VITIDQRHNNIATPSYPFLPQTQAIIMGGENSFGEMFGGIIGGMMVHELEAISKVSGVFQSLESYDIGLCFPLYTYLLSLDESHHALAFKKLAILLRARDSAFRLL